MDITDFKIPTVSELSALGKNPEILFWVGCAGSYDERAQRVTLAFAKILNHCNINFAVLGNEESCTGDPAKRAGNEFLFQMQALSNIEILNTYEIRKIVTACPHCFNTLKNEYPELGGNFEVIHHTQLIEELIKSGKLTTENKQAFKGKKITFHDPCYLGRGNEVYQAPRTLLETLDSDLVELKRCKQNGLCCGAGGAQMFKEPEKGLKDINLERMEDIKSSKANVVAVGCPFCMTMIKDGVKNEELESTIEVLDIAEITAKQYNL